jgi:hypothetical protein
MMGKWNNVVEGTTYRNLVGPRGLGRRNHTVHMLIECFERNRLLTTNTLFIKPKRRLYTCKASENRKRNQLDYILVKHQFGKCTNDVQALAGADADSDCNCGKTYGNEHLKGTISITDDDRSETIGECGIFQLFG